MIDPEYHLVRLTAQSKNADPKKLPGGVTDLTQQDIEALCSSVASIFAYWAVTAKYCQSDISEANLLEAMQMLSWSAWRGNLLHREVNLTVELSDKLAQVAMIYFLSPRDQAGNLRNDEFAAGYIGRHRNTFSTRYKRHWQALLGKLQNLEAEGLNDIRQALRHSRTLPV